MDEQQQAMVDAGELAAEYQKAKAVLSGERASAVAKSKAETSKRLRLAGIVIVVWVVIAVALVALLGNDLLIVGEIGLVAIVAWAVFRLLPSIIATGNLDELFDQYDQQLDKLQQAGIPLQPFATAEELVEAMNVASDFLPAEQAAD